jgi:8-oxo-dGTP diphosphatase
MVDVVCGVIEDGAGRYLVCRRPPGKHLGGLWEFPGGKVEDGEAPQEALARELAEELGVRVTVGEALKPVVWSYDRGRIRLLPFFCRITQGEPRPLEHDQLHWCELGGFNILAWAPADVPVLDELKSRAFP